VGKSIPPQPEAKRGSAIQPTKCLACSISLHVWHVPSRFMYATCRVQTFQSTKYLAYCMSFHVCKVSCSFELLNKPSRYRQYAVFSVSSEYRGNPVIFYGYNYPHIFAADKDQTQPPNTLWTVDKKLLLFLFHEIFDVWAEFYHNFWYLFLGRGLARSFQILGERKSSSPPSDVKFAKKKLVGLMAKRFASSCEAYFPQL